MQLQISKIQLRRSLLENLHGVNLSCGEMHWAIDQRRLFIGNGEIAEGAPDVGNTEVFTEHTDHLNLMQHRYAANALDVLTGDVNPTVNQSWQVPRVLQDRLDDQVSVKSFGARGDGSIAASDIAAETLNLRRAIFEIYLKRGFDQASYALDPTYFGSWKVLYWPAGIYVIDRPLPLVRKSIWIGDGSGRTVIVMRNSNPVHNFVVGTSVFARPEFGYPSDQQLINDSTTGETFRFNFVVPQATGNFLGYPIEDVIVSGMSFINDNNGGDVALLTNVINARFSDVDFIGASYDDSAIRPPNGEEMPVGAIAASKAVHIRSTATASGFDWQSRRIHFDDCWFGKRGFGIYSGDESLMVSVRNSLFYRCYDGVNVGESLLSLGSSVPNNGPTAVQVSNSVFNRVRRHSLAVFSAGKGNGSFFNLHENCGIEQDLAITEPVAADADHAMIHFANGTSRNRVIADTFWRENTAVPQVSNSGSNNIIIV